MVSLLNQSMLYRKTIPFTFISTVLREAASILLITSQIPPLSFDRAKKLQSILHGIQSNLNKEID